MVLPRPAIVSGISRFGWKASSASISSRRSTQTEKAAARSFGFQLGTPAARWSNSDAPEPIPSSSRPPESSATVSAERARTAGFRNVIGLTSGPILGRDVTCARAVRQLQASNHGCCGARLSLPRWSATQIVSTPSSSSRCQRRTSSAQGASWSVITLNLMRSAQARESLDEEVDEALRVDVDGDVGVRLPVRPAPEVDVRAPAGELAAAVDDDAAVGRSRRSRAGRRARRRRRRGRASRPSRTARSGTAGRSRTARQRACRRGPSRRGARSPRAGRAPCA